MRRYAAIFIKFFRFNIISQMQYKGNFLLMLPINLVWTLEEIFVTLVLYNYSVRIQEWSQNEFILLIGTYFIVDSLFSSILLPNLQELSERIRTGNLDFFILKPIDSQFMAFTYRIDLGLVYAFSIGVIVIVSSLVHLHLGLTALDILIYILLITSGALTFASIVFILGSFAFKTVKIDYVSSLFLTFAQFCKKPLDIYPALLKKVMLYMIPLGFVAYIPAGYLLGKNNFIWIISFVVSPLLFFISRRVWFMLLKGYEGTSS